MNFVSEMNTAVEGSSHVILVGLAITLALVIALLVRSWALNQRIRSRTQELAENENKYRLLIETAAEGVALSTEREILFANQRTSEILGYTHEELLKLKPVEIIHRDDWQKLRAINALRMNGAPWPKTSIFQAVAKDGRKIFLRLNSTDVTWDGRKAILHLISDITEQVQMEEALRKSEEMFFKAFQTSPDAININRLKDGCYLQVNEGFTQLTGYHAEEVIGKTIHEINMWTYAQEKIRMIKALLKHGEVLDYVASFSLKDGSVRMGSHSARLIELNGERCVLSITRDVDDQIRANRLLQLQLDRLASLRKIDMAIMMDNNLRHTMQIILEQARILLLVDAACILQPSVDGCNLIYAAESGFRSDETIGKAIPIEGTFAGKAYQSGKVVQVPNVRTQKSHFMTERFRNEQFYYYIAFPLVVNNTVQGVLQFMHRKSMTPDRDWLQFAQVLADQSAIAIYSQNLVADLQNANEELEKAYDGTISGWAHALELRDGETQGHSKRVADLAVELARDMGVAAGELVQIRRGALLHDIGKMGIPDEILLKPGPLSEQEWELMRTHPNMAHQLLSAIKFLEAALDIPLFHHERWDGSGYPEGLSGSEIPLAARIFAVVDVWDALTSDRPYRAAWSPDDARRYIKHNAGVLFDPAVVSAFEKLLHRGRITRSQGDPNSVNTLEFLPGSERPHPVSPGHKKFDLTGAKPGG